MLPDDAILVHIGLHKTGTTALQTRLAAAREDLAAHGVTYPGPEHAHHAPAMALVDTVWGWTERRPEVSDRIWRTFAAKVRETRGRVLLSSEFFCQADDEQARKAVETLGAERVHVVLGVRHLAELLPSSWQQYLKTGRMTPYEDWLHHMLREPPTPTVTPSFWRRNDVPAVLDRWVRIVGAERLTVVVVGDGDRERLGRTVSELLGTPPELLTSDVADARANRSMTAPEAELIRRTNVYARQEIPSLRYTQLMRNGAATRMVESRTPGPDEQRLGIPPWAEERVRTIAEAHVAAVVASGVRVVGDVEVLARPFATREQDVPEVVPVQAAAEALIGMLAKTNDYHDAPNLKEVPMEDLVEELRRRSGRRVKRAFRI